MQFCAKLHTEGNVWTGTLKIFGFEHYSYMCVAFCVWTASLFGFYFGLDRNLKFFLLIFGTKFDQQFSNERCNKNCRRINLEHQHVVFILVVPASRSTAP